MGMVRLYRDLIVDAIIGNSNAWMEEEDPPNPNPKEIPPYINPSYVVKGEGIETAMFNFLIENEIDLNEKLVKRNLRYPVITQIPFD